MIKHAAALCAALCFSGGIALAQSPQISDGWNLHRYTITFSGFSVKKDIVRKPLPGETVFTNSEAVGDIAFTCLLERLSATVEVKKIDFAKFVTGQPDIGRSRFRYATLYINDEKKSYNQWRYSPKNKVLLSQARSDTNALYNAVVRGDKVSLKVNGGKKIRLNLPQKDDAFAEFGGACSLGRHR